MLNSEEKIILLTSIHLVLRLKTDLLGNHKLYKVALKIDEKAMT